MELPVYIKLEPWWSDMKIQDFFTFSRSFSAVPLTSKDQESPVCRYGFHKTRDNWGMIGFLVSCLVVYYVTQTNLIHAKIHYIYYPIKKSQSVHFHCYFFSNDKIARQRCLKLSYHVTDRHLTTGNETQLFS